MPESANVKSIPQAARRGERLSDEHLLDLVQRQTFRYFWDGTHPVSGLARDSSQRLADPADDTVSVGGSGFGIMAIVVACERGWVKRKHALARLGGSRADRDYQMSIYVQT